MITLNLSETGTDKTRKFLELVGDAPEGREIRNLVGYDIAEVTREHLYEKDKEPNKLGGKKTHFYRSAGDAVSHEVTNTGAAISINQQGIRQRLEGGVITPKTARALTIPINARAHGKRAREFENTFILDKSDSGDPDTVGVLMQDTGGGRLDALFVLRRRAVQAPDPSVIPDQRTIYETAFLSIFRFLEGLRAF